VVTKQKIEISKDQRTLIFNKKIETFPNLEYFLQNYSFRLWINENQIKEDIEHLRATCLKAQEDNVKNKFKKTKTDWFVRSSSFLFVKIITFYKKFLFLVMLL